MRIKYLSLLISLIFISGGIHTQSMQIKFCGKTSAVVPPKDNGGNDQRHKGALRLDLIRIGKLSQSRTVPFYSLGISPNSFKNGTWVDGCTNNTNATYCSGCTTCRIVEGVNGNVGAAEGKMEGNVRLRTSNDDLYIESTGSQNVVCFVTNPIDLSGQAGKKIEVNVIYEGTTLDGFSTANVNFNYRYNNGNWVNLLNQNSNFLRVIDTAILITVNVPTAVENLDDVINMDISPNPVNDRLFVGLNSKNSFDAIIYIRDLDGKLIHEEPYIISSGKNNIDLDLKNASSGIYLFQIGNKEGRISTKKFIKE